MDFFEAITTRYSVRRYTGEKLTEEQWDTVFQAAFSAPSAHNLQPWHFIRIEEESILEELAHKHPYAKMLPAAGGAILTCADISIQSEVGFAVEDCSAAIQNMLITLNGLGLGGVWIGIYPIEELILEMRRVFHLPENILPIGLMAVGHKEKSGKARQKYDPNKIHVNGW